MFEVQIIGVRSNRGQRVRQRHDAKTGGALKARSFYQVADKVGSSRGAAAIAADENCPAIGPRTGKNFDGLANVTKVYSVEGLGQSILVSGHKFRHHRQFRGRG